MDRQWIVKVNKKHTLHLMQGISSFIQLPLGPDEPGSWWFSTARKETNCFGAHILQHAEGSTKENPRTFITIIIFKAQHFVTLVISA